ncbi:MAG: acyl transferase [Bacteroidota bacterium]
MDFRNEIFNITSEMDFNQATIEIFRFQSIHNPVYHDFIQALKIDPSRINHFTEVPFLPISFFKTHKVSCNPDKPEIIFSSSGTTGMVKSKHYISDLKIYNESIIQGFTHFFGDPRGFMILALVPEPTGFSGSSLGYMTNLLMEEAHPGQRYFFLGDFKGLLDLIQVADSVSRKVMLIGLSSQLLDFFEFCRCEFPELIIIETGGMKGKRKELIREELHSEIRSLTGIHKVYSEYSMTELLSQSYSSGNGLFRTPPWMKILIRDTHDPLSLVENDRTGGINIIDLANYNSCSFIATQDLGRWHGDQGFEVLGRFDESDVRGCNLLS